MSTFPGLTHVALTVTDLPASTAWYRRLLGAEPVLDEDTGPFRHVVFALDGGTLLGLHGFPPGSGAPTEAFDARRPGLDHVAFGCADRAALETWRGRLDAAGIPHGGIVDAHYGSGLAVRDPDGIALEFFAPPA
ncbi:MAG: VOC family protein [Hamadaea sp.]|nr:VOC family protein [Hamadaea sp.]